MRYPIVVGSCLALASLASAPRLARAESGWGETGETIFEHTRAGLRDPHFGMRLYLDDQIPGTLNNVADPTAPGADAQAAAPNGKHLFWDVAFGEKLPIFTWFRVDPERPRYARGLQLNLEAAAFMLLDFTSQSSGVIDTDFRLGGSVDFRPWVPVLDRLSLSVGFFHESTHLGDEYVLSATTVQGNGPPVANPALPYRANPSYQALPVTLSLDWPLAAGFTGRVYGGASAYFGSALPNERYPAEWRVGAELRLNSIHTGPVPASADTDSVFTRALNQLRRRATGLHADEHWPDGSAPRKRRGAFSLEVAYELLAKRRYQPSPSAGPGYAIFDGLPGYWYIHHVLLMGIYNLDTARSSSNALGVSLEYLRGRSPFGQLVEYARVDALTVGLSYYY